MEAGRADRDAGPIAVLPGIAVDALELIRRHLELECIGFDAEAALVRLPCPNPDTVPRLYVARHAGGYAVYFRHDLPREVRRELAALPPERLFDDEGLVARLLAGVELGGEGPSPWRGKSYVFAEAPPGKVYRGAERLGESHRPAIARYDPGLVVTGRAVFAVLVEGEIVASCESSRENAVAAEAWVRALPAHRRRGYARRVTAAWGAHQLGQGKTAYYSHRLDNGASQGVARSLGLRHYIDDVGY